jgi:hypothetical protein
VISICRFAPPSTNDPLCAHRTAGVDVKRPLLVERVDVAIGRKVGLQGSPRDGPESGQSHHPNASQKSASLANSGTVVKRRILMTARVIVSPQDLKHGSDDKFSGPRRERAVDHFGVKTAQILADERLGYFLVAEFGQEPTDCGLSLWMGPVISDAVAETEVPLQPELVRVSLIIFTPASRLLQHQGFHRSRQAVLGRRRVENACDAIEPVECFA